MYERFYSRPVAGGARLGVDAAEAGFAIQAVDDERGVVEPK